MTRQRRTVSLRLILIKNIVVIFLLPFVLFGQKIEIGQSARDVKDMIEWYTRDHNRIDSYGNTASSIVAWDVVYENGQIVEVIHCFYRQYIIDFGISADFCNHYIMTNGRLEYFLTQFETVSLSELKKLYNRSYPRQVGNLYFSADYQGYSKIYLHANGLATVERRKTILNELPVNIRNKVNQAYRPKESTSGKYYINSKGGLSLKSTRGSDRTNAVRIQDSVALERIASQQTIEATVNGFANLRDRPLMSGSTVERLANGTKVHVFSYTNGYWVINYQGLVLYCREVSLKGNGLEAIKSIGIKKDSEREREEQ